MTLQQLELILAVADSGSVHGACHLLRKTQPTLTKALKQLEEELGVPIFVRSSRGMTPTTIGLTVIARTRVICSEAQKLREDVAQQLGATDGKVSVCVSPLVAFALMPGVLSDFRKKWPDVEINITEAVYPESLNRLREGRADICVGPNPPEISREFNEEALFKTRLVAVTKRDSGYKNLPLNALSEAPWVVMSSQKGPGRHYTEVFLKNGLQPPRRVTWLDSFTALLEFVRHADCCCLFPEQLFRLLPDSLGLQMIETFNSSPSVDICLFTKPDSPLTPAAEALERLIRSYGNNFLR